MSRKDTILYIMIKASTGYEGDCADFIDPARDVSLKDQLGLMTDFNNEFGLKVLKLGRQQTRNLGSVLAEY